MSDACYFSLAHGSYSGFIFIFEVLNPPYHEKFPPKEKQTPTKSQSNLHREPELPVSGNDACRKGESHEPLTKNVTNPGQYHKGKRPMGLRVCSYPYLH